MMRALKFTFLVGAVLVLAPPTFPHFVKAALGFRLGYSPTEQGYGQKAVIAGEKKAVGVQLLSGVNNGGWHSPDRLKAAGSGYGVGLRTTRSAGGSALDAHAGSGGVRHLRILGLNLYLGGRAANLGVGQPLNHYQTPITKKSILSGHAPYTGILGTLRNPLNLGANIGAGIKPQVTNAPNGGQNYGGIAGIRASVGGPKYGIGFNLGYRQNLLNSKSPLGWALGLSNNQGLNNQGLNNQGLNNQGLNNQGLNNQGLNNQGLNNQGLNNQGLHNQGLRLNSQNAPNSLRGQDQVIFNGGGLLKGHGHSLNNNLLAYSPVVASPSLYTGFPQNLESQIITGLESQQHLSTQPLNGQASEVNQVTAASNQQSTQQRAPKAQQQNNNNNNNNNQRNQNQNQQQQIVAQQSVLHPQQLQAPQQQQQQQHQQRYFPGPLALGSTMRNNFLSLFSRGRPSVLRPTPYQYNFNSPASPQALGSGPVRSVLNPHQQRPQAAPQQNEWSTLYPVNGQQAAATNAFLNPIPANGQSLSKLQSSLRPGTVTNVPLHQQQIPSAQNQIPYVQQPRYSGFLSQGLRGIFGLGRQPPQNYPQQQQQQYYNPQQLQRPGGIIAQGHNAQLAAAQLNGGQLTAAQLNAAQLGAAQLASAGAAQQGQGQDYNLYSQNLPNPFQGLQNFQNNFPQQSPFFNPSQLQEQSGQSAQGSTNAQTKQNAPLLPFLPQFPFAADSPAFSAHPAFRYSHSTHSKPVQMGAYTLNMDVTDGGSSAADTSGSASSTPIYGPGGRRIKKTKKTRGDIIIMKKQDNDTPSPPKTIRQLPLDIMETSASNNHNQITLASSIGATSWTPMVMVDPPRLTKKSLEAPVSASVTVLNKKPHMLSQPKLKSPSRVHMLPVNTPAPTPERTMILRKRRLNEGELTSPTVVPTSAPTTSAPTTTTTTTTVPPSTIAPSSPVPSSTAVPVTTMEVSA